MDKQKEQVENSRNNENLEKDRVNGAVALVDIFDDFLFSRGQRSEESAGHDYQFEDIDSDYNDDGPEDNSRKKMKLSNRSMSEEQKLERR